MVRLQKYLAECGIASRRQAEVLIQEGRVTVNGETARLGATVEPEQDAIALDGNPVHPQNLVYILLNKPAGCVTTAKDTHGRKTVLDYVADAPARVYPVGRLDMDVEGALILTNDGDLAYRLMHPKFEVEKTYVAWVYGKMTPETAERLAAGVELEDGKTAPAKVEIQQYRPNATQVRLTLHEGKKREVKRMCEAVGHRIQSLARVAFAGIKTIALKPGQWRPLTPKEIEHLKAQGIQ